MTEDLPLVVSAEQLLGLAELEDIVYYAVSATRRNEPGPEVTTDAFALFVLHDGLRIEVRCRATIDTADAQYVVDAASRFALKQPITIAEDAKKEFVQRVGLMAVWPYIRESVAESAAKLRLGPLQLKLLRSEDIVMTSSPQPANLGG